MSQHYHTTTLAGRPVTGLLGWDRRLRHEFMVDRLEPGASADPDDADDPARYLYSTNLDEHDAFAKNLDYCRQKLNELDIQVPESMWVQVAHDRDMNVGNRHVQHAADVTFRDC